MNESIMSVGLDQKIAAKNKLTQLLDYVAHQAESNTKIPYEVNSESIASNDLKMLAGVKILSDDDEWWFEIQRVRLLEQPQLLAEFKNYIHVENDIVPTIIFDHLAQVISFKETNYKITPYVTQTTQIDKKLDLIKRVFQAFATYSLVWNEYYIKNIELKKSIKIYDQLFSRKTSIQLGGAIDGEEVVAGFGIAHWILPSSQKNYSYPLITIPVEMEIEKTGLIRVGPKDTRANIEMDAILLEDAIISSGQIKLDLKENLNNGRVLQLFEPDSYTDLVQAFVSSISSTGVAVETEKSLRPAKDLVVNLTALLFSRPRKNSILSDDIEALKLKLNDPDVEIPEQPLSLVTALDNSVKAKDTYSFRGRSGIEGYGSNVEELFFPLPYNKEQITIVQNLLTSSGVVVQGPPGTGKTHSIANIICHYLANGKKVLVTAQQAHVLKTVHEKIPADLKSLVISRIGSSKESKNKLESSIDNIVQEISQMNVSEVKRSIESLTQQIDHNHHEMGIVDREIYNFAQKHYQNIEVDGNKKLPMDIAASVLKNSALYSWFIDQLTLDEKDKFPFSNVELVQLRDSRQRIGADLSFLDYGDLPDPSKIIDSINLKNLCQFLKEKQEIIEYLALNDIHSFKEDISESKIEVLREWLIQYLEQLDDVLGDHTLGSQVLNSHLSGNQAHQNHLTDNKEQWLLGFHSKINAEDKAMELEIYAKLIKEAQPLLDYRRKLLTEPIELNFEVEANSKDYQAIQRGAETGKPFSWYHFATPDVQAKFKDIKVSGKHPDTPAEWQLISDYVGNKLIMNTFMSKWNSIAAQLDIPFIELNGRSVDEILKEFTQLINKTQKCIELKNLYLDAFNTNYSPVFKRAKSFELYGKSQNINDLLLLIDKKTKIYKLEVYERQLQDQKLYLQEFDNPLSLRLKDIVNLVDLEKSLDDVYLDEYAGLIKDLIRLKDLKSDFERVKNASQRLAATNALNLSKEIIQKPFVSTLEDPVLPAALVDAWEWKRLENYVRLISDTSKIENLHERRRIFEQNLSTHYAQLAAKKTWLALKENASDKILVALQRYKVAVQKIGKGTGKNSPRYRKDAQLALKEAADAIPCWIMSHAQVSETMPADLGLFDLVIVDEASQSSIEVLPVLMRAKKLLVVGDNKQVSPSNVGLSSAQIDVLRNKYLVGQPHAAYLTPDMSLYDMASSIYESSVMLLEHFRCHPAIIAYSNKNFYDNRIKPMRLSRKSEQLSPALISIYTPQGYRESKGNKHINRIEAQAIIEEVGLILNDAKYKDRTIGVISLLGSAQADFIQAEALNTFGAELLTKVQFACGEASSFQGAERDIIFLSMVSDPQNCFALSRLEHEQRFNVAASRARERMYLVHSVKQDDVSAKDLRLNLLSHFYDVQEDESQSFEQSLMLCESEFEKSVFTTLHEMGYKITPQVKVGSYRIDLVVESDGDQRLAIECDGDSYHGPEQWHNDMIRQRALERAGWTFWRCFASSWEIERFNMLTSLQNQLNAMGIKPTDHASNHSLTQDVAHKTYFYQEPVQTLATVEALEKLETAD